MIIAGKTYATAGGRSVVLIHGIFVDESDRLVAAGSEFNRLGEHLGCSEWDAETGAFYIDSQTASPLDLTQIIDTRPQPRQRRADQNESLHYHAQAIRSF